MRGSRFLWTSLVLAAALSLGAGTAVAQEETELRFGLKGAITIAQLSDYTDRTQLDFDADNGFAVGASVAFSLGDRLSLQPELWYQQRNTELGGPMANGAGHGFGPGGFGDGGVELETSYLELPVLVKYSVGDDDFVPVFFGGPSVALNLSSEISGHFNGQEFEEDVADETSDLDFGLTFGVGLELSERFTAEARYILGLTDADDTGEGNDLRWRTLLFAVGVIF